jgi:hypothetical protein
MELTPASVQLYEQAVKNLFPRGSYWDAQFADPLNGASLFCKAKAGEIFRFRSRMEALRNESLPALSSETIDDWERVLLGEISPGLPLERRRELLNSFMPLISKREIRRIGEKHSVTVFDVSFPRSSSAFPLIRAYLEGEPLACAKNIVSAMLGGARFGSARCGRDRLACISAEYALRLFTESGVCLPFEREAQSKILANQTAAFLYHIRWEDEGPAPCYGAASLIGDLIYDAEKFILSVSLKEVLYDGNIPWLQNTGG